MEAPQTKFTAAKKAIFVEAYAKTGEKKGAAAVAGVNLQTMYNHVSSDPEFAARCEAARNNLLQTLVGHVRKLAFDGVKKTTYDKDGNKVSETMVYSERMLLAWIKRLERDKWGDKVAVDAKVNATVRTVQEIKPAQLDRTQRNRVRDLLDSLPDEPSKN